MTETNSLIRHNWSLTEIKALFSMPFNDLVFQAQTIHRQNFDPNAVQISTLLSIKTGACPEDCSYCPQSAKYDTGLERERLLPIEEVKQAAINAKENGASRFCMGAAWRNPTDKNLDKVIEMISVVRDLGMETCVTLGMLTQQQSKKLKEAGLDYYNHNLDTSPEYYRDIITTRTYQDRLDTLENVRAENINVCCGGIVGMGETDTDRAALIQQLANLPEHPQSVPINLLVQVENTPLYGTDKLDPIEFVRTIAVARIVMPASVVRLSAGRNDMTDEMQALCFLAGANSIFYGDMLLTTPNPEQNTDMELFARLGIQPNAEQQKSAVEETATA
ncbi:MAG: biotin synthase [Gammaproteobacteria bacterium]|jgi:biotin synthase